MLQHYSAYIAEIKMLITCYLGTKVNKFSGLSNLCQFKSTSKQIKGITGKNSFCSSNNQNKPPLEQNKKKEIILKFVLLYVYTTSKYHNLKSVGEQPWKVINPFFLSEIIFFIESIIEFHFVYEKYMNIDRHSIMIDIQFK